MMCGMHKEKRSVPWVPPLDGVLKFNVEGAAKGKPR